MGIFDIFRGRSSFERSELGGALRAHVNEFFYGETLLSQFREENKKRLIDDMHQKLVDAQKSDNPVMTLREILANYVLAYAPLQVLALTEEERPFTQYGANPFITGTLHREIDAAAEFVPELHRHKWEVEASGDALIGFCNVRACIYLFNMNAFNMALIAIGDVTEPHWYRPLVEAALVYAEHNLRLNMGKAPQLDLRDALAYSTFVNLVADGERAPFFKWATDYPDLYLGGRGPMSEAGA